MGELLAQQKELNSPEVAPNLRANLRMVAQKLTRGGNRSWAKLFAWSGAYRRAYCSGQIGIPAPTLLAVCYELQVPVLDLLKLSPLPWEPSDSLLQRVKECCVPTAKQRRNWAALTVPWSISSPNAAVHLREPEQPGNLPFFYFGAGPPVGAFDLTTKTVWRKNAMQRARTNPEENLLRHFPQLCQQLAEGRAGWHTKQLAPLRRQVEYFLSTTEEDSASARGQAAVEQSTLQHLFSKSSEKAQIASEQRRTEMRRQNGEALFVEVYQIVVDLINKGLPVCLAPVQMLLGTDLIKNQGLIQQAIDWAMAQWMSEV